MDNSRLSFCGLLAKFETGICTLTFSSYFTILSISDRSLPLPRPSPFLAQLTSPFPGPAKDNTLTWSFVWSSMTSTACLADFFDSTRDLIATGRWAGARLFVSSSKSSSWKLNHRHNLIKCLLHHTITNYSDITKWKKWEKKAKARTRFCIDITNVRLSVHNIGNT